MTTYLINSATCYAFDYASQFTANYTFLDARASSNSLMMQFFVFAKACQNKASCQVYVTRRGNLNVKSSGGKPLILGNHVMLSYQKQELNLLPPPYTTKCFDYLEHGIHSQDQCIAYYERVHMKKANRTILKSFVPVVRGENIGRHPKWGKPSPWSLSKCKRTPCRLEQYNVQDSIKPRDNDTLALVSLMFPENGELTVNYKPQFTLCEFLTLFGSVFSLWLGFNGLALANIVLSGIFRCSNLF